MSTLCPTCPTCGSIDVRTRLLTPMVAECVCRVCRKAWTVAIERTAE